jgi:hypothetical protein
MQPGSVAATKTNFSVSSVPLKPQHREHGAAFGRNQKKTTTEAQSSQRKAKASFGVNLLWVRH